MAAAATKKISLAVVNTGAPPKGPVGRYTNQQDARLPGNGVARPAPSQNVRTAIAAVQDPLEPKARLLVTVNRAVDTLEMERSHNRISEGAYRVGRECQAMFEAASRSSSTGSAWINETRGDPAQAHIRQLAAGKARAEEIMAFEERLNRTIGEMGTRFMRQILGENRSFQEMAGALPSERKVAFIAQRFRVYLEELDEAWAARGRSR